MKTSFPLVAILVLAVLGSGCTNTVPFHVTYDKLKPAKTPRQGVLGVKALVDARSVTNAMQIGGAGKKVAFVVEQKRPVADVMTDAVRDALEKSGYRVSSEVGAGVPVLQGDIREFWLSNEWKAICRIQVELRLRKGDGGAVLWEKRLTAEEDDLMIVPNAMTAAINTVLKAAMVEFASQPFFEAVAGSKP